jgi:hypothetical protein
MAAFLLDPYQLKLLHHLIQNETQYNDHFFKWKMPVKLCWGEYDVLIPMKNMQSDYEAISNSRFRPSCFFRMQRMPSMWNHRKLFVSYVKALMGVFITKQMIIFYSPTGQVFFL